MSFASLGLIDPIVRTLDALAYHTPTAVQEQAIPAVLAGSDVMAAAQTGTGKTAGFALPMLQRLSWAARGRPQLRRARWCWCPRANWPSRCTKAFAPTAPTCRCASMVAYGGVSINPQMMKLRKGVDVLVATPGRLLDLHRQNAVHVRRSEDAGAGRGRPHARPGLFARARRHPAIAAEEAPDAAVFGNLLGPDPGAGRTRCCANRCASRPRRATRTVAAIRQWVIPVDKKRKAALFVHLLERRDWSAGAGLRPYPQGCR